MRYSLLYSSLSSRAEFSRVQLTQTTPSVPILLLLILLHETIETTRVDPLSSTAKYAATYSTPLYPSVHSLLLFRKQYQPSQD
jgi:hypothetical protein